MGDNLYLILEVCGAVGLFICVVGIASLIIAARRAEDDFRDKGYMLIPWGMEWFDFLHREHYERFEDPAVRFFFGIAHLCMVLFLIVVLAAVVLLGTALAFNS